jgi:hypothetical protein
VDPKRMALREVSGRRAVLFRISPGAIA